MTTEFRVPTLGESVTEATIGRWFKQPGEPVKADEPLLELETDKVTLEVNAPTDGVLGEQRAKEGETVAVNAVLGSITEGTGAAAAKAAPTKAPEPKKAPPQLAPTAVASAMPKAAPAAVGADGPAVQRLAAESGVDPRSVGGLRQGWTGDQGRHAAGDRRSAGRSPRAPFRPLPRRRCNCARRRRPRMRRARSACA